MGLIKALQREGHEVVAVAPTDEHSVRLEAEGVLFLPWPLSPRGISPLGELMALLRLLMIYWRVRPDVCFHYTIKPVLYGAIVSALLRQYFVSVITGLGYSFLNDGWVARISKRLYRAILGKSYRVWFLNRDDLQEFIRNGLVNPALAEVLPGEGVDAQHFHPGPQRASLVGRACVFLMVARLLVDKGVGEFVEACRLLRERGHDVRGVLLGGRGVENPSAVSDDQLAAWQQAGAVEFAGQVLDVRPAVWGADCVVLPSYREGLPRALLEAAAMATPVIATDVPGCRDVVLPGVSGLLCAPRDAHSLADAMAAFLALGDESRAEMGRAGRALVERCFGEQIIVSRYLELLRQLPFSFSRGSAAAHEGPGG